MRKTPQSVDVLRRPFSNEDAPRRPAEILGRNREDPHVQPISTGIPREVLRNSGWVWLFQRDELNRR